MSHPHPTIPAFEGPYKQFFEAAAAVAVQAGGIIREAFHKPKNMHTKSEDTDLVTETDRQCEEIVVAALKRQFPDHAFVGEENISQGLAKEELTDAPTWMIDPIDGTTNFVHKFPFCCVSIGFAIKKENILGIVYNPIMEEFFCAVKGQGSYLNGQRLQVTATQELKKCLVGTGFPYDRSDATLDWVLANVKSILQHCRAVRRAGSAALDMCYVARGSLDIYYEKGVHAWDIAAGTIIVTEAGGVVEDPYKKDSHVDMCGGRVICGNATVVKQLIEHITPPPASLSH